MCLQNSSTMPVSPKGILRLRFAASFNSEASFHARVTQPLGKSLNRASHCLLEGVLGAGDFPTLLLRPPTLPPSRCCPFLPPESGLGSDEALRFIPPELLRACANDSCSWNGKFKSFSCIDRCDPRKKSLLRTQDS